MFIFLVETERNKIIINNLVDRIKESFLSGGWLRVEFLGAEAALASRGDLLAQTSQSGSGLVEARLANVSVLREHAVAGTLEVNGVYHHYAIGTVVLALGALKNELPRTSTELNSTYTTTKNRY